MIRVLLVLAIVAVVVALLGCASTGRPRVIFTADDDMIVQQGSRCWKVIKIDYDGDRDELDDLAYGTLQPIVCPTK